MSRRPEDRYEDDARDRRGRDSRDSRPQPDSQNARRQIDPRDPLQPIDLRGLPRTALPMSQRSEDLYADESRDRRSRDPRDARFQTDSRDLRGQIDPRDPLKSIDPRRLPGTGGRDLDRFESRDTLLDPQRQRDAASRPTYSYPGLAYRRDTGSTPGGYVEDTQDRRRAPSASRREDPSLRFQEYFLPAEDINREVIQDDICRYLGNDATVRPYNHPDGRQGYLIRAYRAPTTAMIATLKQDSKRFEVEQAQRRRQFSQSGMSFGASATFDDRQVEQAQRRRQLGQSGMSFGASTTFDDRQRQGRPDAPQSGYAGYGMDTSMDDYEDDRVRAYDEPRMNRLFDPRMESGVDPRVDLRMDPRVDSRMDPRVDSRMDPRVDPRVDPYSRRDRSMGSYITPPPSMGRAGQAIFSQGYPVATSAGYSIPTSAPLGSAARHAEHTNVAFVPDRAGAGHPGWGDTPNFGGDPAP